MKLYHDKKNVSYNEERTKKKYYLQLCLKKDLVFGHYKHGMVEVCDYYKI